MASENCAHTGCKCKVETGKGISQGGKNYCSTQCAQAASQSEASKCTCGHAGCKQQRDVTTVALRSNRLNDGDDSCDRLEQATVKVPYRIVLVFLEERLMADTMR